MELAFYKSKEANDGNKAFTFDKKNEIHKCHRMIAKKKSNNVSHIEKGPNSTMMKHN
jgi:hypothetical protein